MIIINDKPGQLCNRLWAYSFFIAYAQKHSLKIYIPHFREYQQYFENLSLLANVSFNILSKPKVLDLLTFQAYRILSKLLRIICRVIDLSVLNIYIDEKHWSQEHWQLTMMSRNNKIFFLGSWFHQKDVSALLEYKQQIRMLFEPAMRYRNRVDNLFTEICRRYDIIIGIHIRRGDYREFHGGAYYYDDEEYKWYINALKNLFPQNNVCFYLSSDQPFVKTAYCEYETVSLQNSAMVEDLYALSKCHFILGPPSSFSMWASFIGNVPLRIVKYKNENIALDQFSPILYQNVFKNGEHFHHIDKNIYTELNEKSFIE
jgi:hypothetical protein